MNKLPSILDANGIPAVHLKNPMGCISVDGTAFLVESGSDVYVWLGHLVPNTNWPTVLVEQGGVSHKEQGFDETLNLGCARGIPVLPGGLEC